MSIVAIEREITNHLEKKLYNNDKNIIDMILKFVKCKDCNEIEHLSCYCLRCEDCFEKLSSGCVCNKTCDGCKKVKDDVVIDNNLCELCHSVDLKLCEECSDNEFYNDGNLIDIQYCDECDRPYCQNCKAIGEIDTCRECDNLIEYNDGYICESDCECNDCSYEKMKANQIW